MKRILILSIGYFVLTALLNAQKPVCLTGQIYDKNTGQPVPFATVSLKEKYFGVISNEDGSFRIPEIKDTINWTLEVRHLGYEPISLKLSELDISKNLDIFLEEASYSVDEVVIRERRKRRPDPGDIVETAVQKIKDNYPAYPFQLKGYYRDYLKIDSSYVNLYEADVEIEDLGFASNDYDQTKIKVNAGMMNQNFMIDSSRILDYGDNRVKSIPYGKTEYYGGNEIVFLGIHNPIRNYNLRSFDFIRTLQTDFLNDHLFVLKGLVTSDSLPVYCIEFSYKEKDPDIYSETGSITTIYGNRPIKMPFTVKGVLFIQSKTFIINRMEYEVSLMNKKNKEVLWNLNLEYRNIKGVPFLNYISFNNEIEIPEYADERYFHLKNIIIDRPDNCLKLTFNNILEPGQAKNPGNYRVKLDDRILEITGIEVADTMVTLMLKDYEKYFNGQPLEEIGSLKVDVTNLKDTKGNLINDLKTIKANQYRELFVNNITQDFIPIPESECVDKRKSMIYSRISNKKETVMKNFNPPLLKE